MKVPFIPLVLTATILISGCSGNFEDEAQRIQQKKDEMKKEKEVEKKKVKEQEGKYKDMEKPLDEVILENDLDVVREVDSLEVEKKAQYEDETEFSKYAAQVLYYFYTLQISPKQYYEFIMEHGSEKVKSELPSEKDAIAILFNLQEMFKKQNINGESYTLTNVALDRVKREGNFYRKVHTSNGEEFFMTIIKKENGVWKYEDDSPAPPYELGTDLTALSEEQ